jgi:hypothetical protein
MNRGTNSPIRGFSPNRMVVMAAALGGGAAANGTLPTNGTATPTTGTYPKAENFAASLTYNAATGKYYVTLSESVKHILYADAVIVAAGGAPTAALTPVVTSIDQSLKRIYFNSYTPAGVLTDMGTSDLVLVRCEIADTGAIG